MNIDELIEKVNKYLNEHPTTKATVIVAILACIFNTFYDIGMFIGRLLAH